MDIKVSKDEWLALSDEDKAKIEEILKSAGAMSTGDKIVGDAREAPFTMSNLPMADGPCQSACTAAYGGQLEYVALCPIPAREPFATRQQWLRMPCA